MILADIQYFKDFTGVFFCWETVLFSN